jgi:TolB-like protein/class 3 adenylate cyclase/tetratricopeptide (TPR) repeat protein
VLEKKPFRDRTGSNARPLPTGTVTFLFTDISGSTRLWENHPDAMRVALARHDTLLERAISAAGGRVFKRGGDSFCAVFSRASDGLTAALAAQRALHAECWPADAAITVRMALHSGTAQLRDGDYFGAPLNRVARLMAAAHGGQTLVSDAAYDACKDALPRDVQLKLLGIHTLKDVPERTAVFQLCHPDLQESFPALTGSAIENMQSIAVLPFVNLSGDEQNEYFADGLAEELLNVLAKIDGLRVAARSSAFTFKGRKASVAEVGSALNVATVLEGSVRNAGNRMRISVQLVKVADGFDMWSASYDRTLEDIFAVQDDIAQCVVKELRRTLLGEPVVATAATQVTAQIAAAVKGRTTDAEAHRLDLQARHFLSRHTRDDTAKGIAYLKRALDRDPAFALAWVELSGAYTNEVGQGWRSAAEGLELARQAVERALKLEPELAEAHAQLGWIRMTYDWDWRGAEVAYGRALELAPGSGFVLRRAGWLAANLGHLDDAIALNSRAIEQDPLSASTYHSLGMALEAAGRLVEAEHAYRKVIELSPQRGAAHAILGLNLLAQGRHDEALDEALREPERWAQLWALAIVQHARGCDAEGNAALSELVARYADGAGCNIAQVYGARGDVDLALEWLERAYVQRDAGLSEMKSQPLLRSLHSDSRWDAFLRKMGLAD